ncbi:hypothetical protein E1263_25475 [Kribbella antibiotica]|uniref:Prevent-host-death family protein n=1 Tax=Kribbella antibiotica TaxID=190195 RepID=A0A4R4ZE50_9ACTN|nr:hypothetical protein [Kribbella antibiotica]TDD56326.1 hypothetical protein E1263_25475 [Kribbella antibiotica]
MADLLEVTFSDLLQRPVETVEKLKSTRRQALLVRRRGAEDDLVLTTVAQTSENHQILVLTVRVLRAVMGNPETRSRLVLEMLPQVFPWSAFLPPRARDEFAQELVDMLDASAELRVSAPVLTLITQWRNTAEIYADPELLAILTSPERGDFGPVPRPPTTD